KWTRDLPRSLGWSSFMMFLRRSDGRSVFRSADWRFRHEPESTSGSSWLKRWRRAPCTEPAWAAAIARRCPGDTSAKVPLGRTNVENHEHGASGHRCFARLRAEKFPAVLYQGLPRNSRGILL